MGRPESSAHLHEIGTHVMVREAWSGQVMNYYWNDACTRADGYLVARPGDEDCPELWVACGPSQAQAGAESGEGA